MAELLGELLFNMLRSTAFWVVLGIWAFILIAWTAKSKAVLERTVNLIRKPVIFKTDSQPENVPLYPRKFFEEIATPFRDFLKKPFTQALHGFSGWIKKNLHPLIYDAKHPYRLPASLLFLVLFGLFLLADVIAVANTLAILDLFTGDLTGILSKYDYAVLAGSLAALLVGVMVVIELSERESVLTDLSEKPEGVRGISRGLALLVTLLAFFSLITWALARQIELGNIESTPFLDGIVQWVLFGVVPINSAIAAAIIFVYAFKGAMVIITGILWMVVAIIWLLDWLATIVGVVIPFTIDVLYRTVHIVLDIIQWIITTPVHAVLMPFIMIGRMIFPPPKP